MAHQKHNVVTMDQISHREVRSKARARSVPTALLIQTKVIVVGSNDDRPVGDDLRARVLQNYIHIPKPRVLADTAVARGVISHLQNLANFVLNSYMHV